jgi:hypothetical protein
VEIVDRREGLGQVAVDEGHDATQRLDADLDEHRGRLFDVLACRFDQAWGLPELRQDAAGAVRLRRVVEDRLRREARRKNLGIGVRIALPRSDLLELEHP